MSLVKASTITISASFLLLFKLMLIVKIWRWWRSLLPQRIERVSRLLLRHVEADRDYDPPDAWAEEPDEVHPRETLRITGNFWAWIVGQLKAKYDLSKDTPAMREVVRTEIYTLCRKHGVRPSHMAANMAIVIEVCFVPSRGEVEAVQARQSSIASGRRDLFARPWHSLWWWLPVAKTAQP